ncbi:MAG: translation initiation factor IF-3, partial [Deltaproteobacteria bacterium]|nr:translation initiation factor IF-3 [Deltaproteobacteria bacterium]
MKPRRGEPQDLVRRNEQIRAREVRVIGAEGEQLGILNRNDAIAAAKELGLDLVEVAATADPPVCRISVRKPICGTKNWATRFGA